MSSITTLTKTVLRDGGVPAPDQRDDRAKKRKRLPKNRRKARLAVENRVKYRRAQDSIRRADHERSARIYEEFLSNKNSHAERDAEISLPESVYDDLKPVIVNKRCRIAGSLLEHGLTLLWGVREHWIRSPKTWVCRGKAPQAQYESLVRHLLIRYPVPRFLMKVFEPELDHMEDIKAWRTFVIGVAQGQPAARLAKETLASPLTRKMVHRLLTLRGEHSPLSAIRRVQVETWCKEGHHRVLAIHNAIMGSRIGDGMGERRILLSQPREMFWSQVIQRFCLWSELHPRDISPLIDYIDERDSHWRIEGRTARSLLRDMEEWHEQLIQTSLSENIDFAPSGLKNHVWIKKQKGKPFVDVYQIGEILSAEDLYLEGRLLSHCVASYCNKVKRGSISIWSLRRRRRNGTGAVNMSSGLNSVRPVFRRWQDRQLTIEVNNRTREVIQVRGKFNRLPTEEEKKWVWRWAVKNRLKWKARL